VATGLSAGGAAAWTALWTVIAQAKIETAMTTRTGNME
jgi:hypothetical protein